MPRLLPADELFARNDGLSRNGLRGRRSGCRNRDCDGELDVAAEELNRRDELRAGKVKIGGGERELRAWPERETRQCLRSVEREVAPARLDASTLTARPRLRRRPTRVQEREVAMRRTLDIARVELFAVARVGFARRLRA